MKIQTDFGEVVKDDTETTIHAHHGQLFSWATRSNAVWPNSALALYDEVFVVFDQDGDLIELRVTDEDEDVEAHDISNDELTAWTNDVLKEAGLDGIR